MGLEYKGVYYENVHDINDPMAFTDPVVFTESFLTVPEGDDGIQPFRFNKPDKQEYRNYLFEIYREKHPRVIVVTGRQVEKSTAARNKILADMNTNEGLTALYTAPRAEQVSRFSAERIMTGMIESQGGVLRNSILKKGKDTASFKQFDSKSNLYLYSCWADGDAIRGIAAQRVYADEVQDMTSSARETVEECLGHAKGGGQMFHFGTPKNSGSEFHRLWELSDKKEWYVECQECGQHQKMTLVNILKPDHEKPAYFGCIKCKKELNRGIGKWQAENTGEGKKVHYSGYHITQLMCSWISAENILYKKATYSEQKFKNEVLGEFHNVYGKTLDFQNIMDCTDPKRKLMIKGDVGPNYMGVDWGSGNNSFTVITILGVEEIDKEKRLVYKFVKKYNSTSYGDVIKEIHRLKKLYNVENSVIDIGDARRQFEELLVEYPETVSACQYVLALKTPYKWDKKTRIHTCDRSYHIEKVIDLFHKKKIVIPYDKLTIQVTDELMWLFEHLTSLEAEWVEPSSGNTGYTRYLHSTPDDGFQSLVYAYLAYERRKYIPRSHAHVEMLDYASFSKLFDSSSVFDDSDF
jgi:hypothetical protein